MANRQLENLTHHEALRYDYLYKNIHFLNDKEREELDFLIAKAEGHLQTSEDLSHCQEKDEDDLTFPSEQELSGYSRRARTNRTDQKDNQIDRLPVYPSPKEQKSKAKAVVEKRENDLPTSDKISRDIKAKRKKRFSIKRFFVWLGLILLATLVGMVLMFFKGVHDVTSGNTAYTPAQAEVFNGTDTLDGTNILILGSDKRVTQNLADARTDTIMVMNVGNSSGKPKLVSFMRDTLVNIPGYSSDNTITDLKLNASFNLGEQNGDQGAEFVRQVLKHNFDIDIKYYVMIDFETFAEAIDTLFPEGVEIDAQFETVGGQVVSEVEVPDDLGYAQGGAMYQTITTGLQQMDGKTLLNYARFRGDDTADFGRVKRQQQVLSAIMSQAKNPIKLFTGSAALGKVYALTSTNVSYPLLLSEGLGLFTKGRDNIEQMTVPQQGDWVDAYDVYGGMGLDIDRDKYQQLLAEMGLR